MTHDTLVFAVACLWVSLCAATAMLAADRKRP